MNNKRRVGVWIVGAFGEVATTAMMGVASADLMQMEGRALPGMVTANPEFAALSLVNLDSLVFGGIDVIESDLVSQAKSVGTKARTFSKDLVNSKRGLLDQWSGNIVSDSSFAWRCGDDEASCETINSQIWRFRALLRDFKSRNQLSKVIVLNLASVEVPGQPFETMEDFHAALECERPSVSPSMATAYAAFQEGCSYINFTPNLGPEIPALRQLANDAGVVWCGSDGKTGETLLKTALAPVFLARNLRIQTWQSLNMLGNNDGRSLEDPTRAKRKMQNKKDVLGLILGYSPDSNVMINYVPSLGDWKTAWNFVQFEGFLGVPMSLQFTWQGCDSVLAAPLVLDLVRFTELAAHRGERGALMHLASFFKNPVAGAELGFMEQYQMLVDYASDSIAGRH